MIIYEDRKPFWLTRSEFNLIKEMITEFLLDFPDAQDVVAFDTRITEAYHDIFGDL